MVDTESFRSRLESGGEASRDAGDNTASAGEAVDLGFAKAQSSFEQKKKEIDSSLSHVRHSLYLLKAMRDQANASIDVAKAKADASKKILGAKELAYEEAFAKARNTMSKADDIARDAKSSIESRHRELLKSEELSKFLRTKVESQAVSVEKAPKL
jgi:hypothetical protein